MMWIGNDEKGDAVTRLMKYTPTEYIIIRSCGVFISDIRVDASRGTDFYFKGVYIPSCHSPPHIVLF
jgi:hypothetical protein